MLRKYNPERGFIEWSRETLSLMRAPLFNMQDGIRPNNYNNFCTNLGRPEQRLMFTYFTEANEFAYHAARLNEYHAEAHEYARQAYEIDKDCFPVPVKTINWYKAQFVHTYGYTLLQKAAKLPQVEGKTNQDAQSLYRTARRVLAEAIEWLHPYVHEEETVWKELPLIERIFAGRPQKAIEAKFLSHLKIAQESQ